MSVYHPYQADFSPLPIDRKTIIPFLCVPEPRDVIFISGAGIRPYSYKKITPSTKSWTVPLATARDLAKRAFFQATGIAAPFNCCLVNRYLGGLDSIGWHSDSKDRLLPSCASLTFSLGVTRTYYLRRARSPKTIRERKFGFTLISGSACVFYGPLVQHRWVHSVPKEPLVEGVRYSLSFRVIVP